MEGISCKQVRQHTGMLQAARGGPAGYFKKCFTQCWHQCAGCMIQQDCHSMDAGRKPCPQYAGCLGECESGKLGFWPLERALEGFWLGPCWVTAALHCRTWRHECHMAGHFMPLPKACVVCMPCHGSGVQHPTGSKYP
jgi:hypothetical protein